MRERSRFALDPATRDLCSGLELKSSSSCGFGVSRPALKARLFVCGATCGATSSRYSSALRFVEGDAVWRFDTWRWPESFEVSLGEVTILERYRNGDAKIDLAIFVGRLETGRGDGKAVVRAKLFRSKEICAVNATAQSHG